MKTKSLIIAVSVTCLIAVVLLFGWIFAAYKSYAFRSEVAVITEDIRSKLSEDSYFISLRSALREAKPQIESVEKRFISKEEVPTFISMLESEATKLGLKVDFSAIDIKPGESLDGTLSMLITGEGSWSTVTNFIATLDSLPYASTIGSIRLSNTSVVEGEDWKFNIEFIQYLGKKI